MVLTLEQCLEIKEAMLNKNYNHNKEKSKLALKYNVSIATIGRIWYGTYTISDKIGGGAKQWGIKNLRNWQRIINFNQALEIKNKLLNDNYKSFSYKYRLLAEYYNCSFDTIKQIKLGKHSFSKDLGGSYSDWIKKL